MPRHDDSGSEEEERPPRGRGGGSGGSDAERLKAFWRTMQAESEAVPTTDLLTFKNHQLPLARIKKIMKSDEDVRMISAEAPVLFAKACELFILELTLKAWMHAEGSKRRTLQRSDVAAIIHGTYIFDFLQDIVPKEGEGGGGAGPSGAGAGDAAAAPPLDAAGGGGGGLPPMGGMAMVGGIPPMMAMPPGYGPPGGMAVPMDPSMGGAFMPGAMYGAPPPQ